MDSLIYCCVWKDGRLMYRYRGGGNEIDEVAALCLEMIPPHHRWYSHTVGGKTFGYLMGDGHVYFAIVDQSIGSLEAQRFLQKLRDEFTRRGSTCRTMPSFTNLNSLPLEEQLLPVVRRLIASLERVSVDTGAGIEWPAENANWHGHGHGHGHRHNQDGSSSTKAPLLGKLSKQEKRKMEEDHVIALTRRDIEMEEDRGVHVQPDSRPTIQPTSMPPLPSSLSNNSTRTKSTSLQIKWCRQVRIILAIDAAICVLLFIIWLAICHGLQCIR